MEHFDAEVNGIRLHVAATGSGDPVVLLHGFPEFWYSWRKHLPTLGAAGFRALAPDLRGYNLSERPDTLRSYRGRELTADIEQLIERYASGRACLVGHDWGGVIAWRVAALRPDLVRKLVILNAPHPAAYQRALRTHPMQWLRSLYVMAFQVPWVAERLLSLGNFWLLEKTLQRQPSNRSAFTVEDIARYKEAFRSPGGVTARLNYYRAALRYPNDLWGEPQRVNVPTLVIWGDRDPYLGKHLTADLHRWVADVRVEHLPDVSHWVQNDAPEAVNRLLIDFFTKV